MLSWNLHGCKSRNMYVYIYILYLYISIYIYIYSHGYIQMCSCISPSRKAHVNAWSNQSLAQLTPAWFIQVPDSGSTSKSRFIRKCNENLLPQKSTNRVFVHCSHKFKSNNEPCVCVLYEYLQVGQFHIQQRKGIPYIWVKPYRIYHTNGPSQKECKSPCLEFLPFCGLEWKVGPYDRYKWSYGGSRNGRKKSRGNYRDITCYNPYIYNRWRGLPL